MHRRTGVVSLALLGFLAAAAPAQAEDPQFTLVIKDHRFAPAELQIPAGVKVELLVKNEDPTPEESESTELHRERVVPPGQQILVIVGPLNAGPYGLFGDFHKESARGKLIAK